MPHMPTLFSRRVKKAAKRRIAIVTGIAAMVRPNSNVAGAGNNDEELER